MGSLILVSLYDHLLPTKGDYPILPSGVPDQSSWLFSSRPAYLLVHGLQSDWKAIYAMVCVPHRFCFPRLFRIASHDLPLPLRLGADKSVPARLVEQIPICLAGKSNCLKSMSSTSTSSTSPSTFHGGPRGYRHVQSQSGCPPRRFGRRTNTSKNTRIVKLGWSTVSQDIHETTFLV